MVMLSHPPPLKLQAGTYGQKCTHCTSKLTLLQRGGSCITIATMISKNTMFVLAVLILVTGSLLWWGQIGMQKTSMDIPVPSTSTPATFTGTKADTVTYEPLTFPDNRIDTSDWQAYRNEKYGFEVKYPKGWKLDFFDYPYPSEQGFLAELSVFPNGVGSAKNSVSVFHIQDLSLEEQRERLLKSEISPFKDKKDVIVNGVYGIKYTALAEDTSEHSGVILAQGDRTFWFYLPNEDVKDAKELKQILLSFKLLR